MADHGGYQIGDVANGYVLTEHGWQPVLAVTVGRHAQGRRDLEAPTGGVGHRRRPEGVPLMVGSGRGSDGDPASGGQALDVAVMPPSSVAMNFVGRTVMTTRTSLSVTS